MKILSFIICFNFYSISIFAQPSWISKIPEGYLNDFFVGRGVGVSKTEATQNAYEDAVVAIMRNNSITVNYSESNVTFTEQKNIDENLRLEIVKKSVQELRFDGESRTIKQLKQIETYYEHNSDTYEAFVLLSLPKKNPLSPPSSFSPVWRSLIIPGWGQLYKDQTFKGFSFMVLTLGGVAGALGFNQMSLDASKSAFSSRTQARRDYFNNNKKLYANYSIISYIAAGLFYSWSLVDAIVVKQENLYVKLDKENSTFILNFAVSF